MAAPHAQRTQLSLGEINGRIVAIVDSVTAVAGDVQINTRTIYEPSQHAEGIRSQIGATQHSTSSAIIVVQKSEQEMQITRKLLAVLFDAVQQTLRTASDIHKIAAQIDTVAHE